MAVWIETQLTSIGTYISGYHMPIREEPRGDSVDAV